MENYKIAEFIYLMAKKLDELSDDVAKNGCRFATIQELDHLVGDALTIKAVIKDSCI